MAYGLKPTYDRTDKRQAAREQEEIVKQWNRVSMEFEEMLFSDDFDERFFQLFNEQWIKWATAFNKRKVVAMANPRAFHDEYINPDYFNWAEEEKEADIQLNYIII